ncbi:hypothetical protein JCM10212_007087 [Sporobolomyces blumeae]
MSDLVAPKIERRRSGSLELDYGEDAELDEPPRSPPTSSSANSSIQLQPIQSLEAAKVSQGNDRAHASEADTRPQIAPVTQPAPQQAPAQSAPTMTLPAGLPANPLTGRVPSAASTSSVPSGAGSNSQLTAVFVSDMHWWTSDAHLVELCGLAGVSVNLREVSFSEHKVNGKSKGVAYIETGSATNASQVKRFVDTNDFQGKRMTATIVIGAGQVSPFKTLPREPHRGQGHNPAAVRPGLRIPPPCTYPYINTKDQAMQQQQKRQFNAPNNNGPGHSGSNGAIPVMNPPISMGMGMTGNGNSFGGGGGGGGGGGNRSQHANGNFNVGGQQGSGMGTANSMGGGMNAGQGGGGQGMGMMGGMSPMGGMGMNGMNFGAMGLGGMGMGGMAMGMPGMGMGMGMGGMDGMYGMPFGGAGSFGTGFDMSGGQGAFGAFGGDMGQMGFQQAGQQGQGNGEARKRTRMDA